MPRFNSSTLIKLSKIRLKSYTTQFIKRNRPKKIIKRQLKNSLRIFIVRYDYYIDQIYTNIYYKSNCTTF